MVFGWIYQLNMKVVQPEVFGLISTYSNPP